MIYCVVQWGHPEGGCGWEPLFPSDVADRGAPEPAPLFLGSLKQVQAVGGGVMAGLKYLINFRREKFLYSIYICNE